MLLVRGSGGISDLISDVFFLKFRDTHPCHVSAIQQDAKQRKLSRFLFHDLKEAGCAMEAFEVDKECWDFLAASKVIDDLNLHSRLHDDKLDTLRARAATLLDGVCGEKRFHSTSEEALKFVSTVLRVAGTDKCWVFDLLSKEPGRDDFKGALIKCLLNGIQTAGKESEETLWKKLKYTMLWNRWVSRALGLVALCFLSQWPASTALKGCGVRVAPGSCTLSSSSLE